MSPFAVRRLVSGAARWSTPSAATDTTPPCGCASAPAGSPRARCFSVWPSPSACSRAWPARARARNLNGEFSQDHHNARLSPSCVRRPPRTMASRLFWNTQALTAYAEWFWFNKFRPRILTFCLHTNYFYLHLKGNLRHHFYFYLSNNDPCFDPLRGGVTLTSFTQVEYFVVWEGLRYFRVNFNGT